MTTREPLPSNDPRIRRWLVRNDQGEEIGTDEEPVPTPEQVNAATMRGRLLQTLATNAAYSALTAPTAAQTTAQTRRNTQQNSALIRLMLEQLDTTDGT